MDDMDIMRPSRITPSQRYTTSDIQFLEPNHNAMKSIIEDTADLLRGMGLEVNPVATAPRFAGIVAKLPNDSQVFFVWSEMDEGDFILELPVSGRARTHFR
jgi:hypothetical protein